jgi:glycosyltransferase involved in cell wall biosynthesis
MARVCVIAFTDFFKDARPKREAESLASRGDHVDFICSREPNTVPIKYANGVRLFQLKGSRYRGSNALIYIMSYLWFFLRASVLVTVLHLRNWYHVVHVHTMPDFLVFAALFPKLLGAKVLLDVHDLMPELYISKFGVSAGHVVVRLLRLVERASICFADRAIAVSQPHLERLVEHGNPRSKFVILLNLPDPRIFRITDRPSHLSDGCFRLVFHGTIAPRHGLDVALQAVALAKTEIPNLRFEILGEGDDKSRLEQMVRDLGLERIVRFSKG